MTNRLALDITGQFKRDFKREKAGRHADLDDALNALIQLLVDERKLPTGYRDHALKGRWQGYRDCHLKPDLVLIYRRTAMAIELVRLGSQSEPFG